jgi:hypothetical protein
LVGHHRPFLMAVQGVDGDIGTAHLRLAQQRLRDVVKMLLQPLAPAASARFAKLRRDTWCGHHFADPRIWCVFVFVLE